MSVDVGDLAPPYAIRFLGIALVQGPLVVQDFLHQQFGGRCISSGPRTKFIAQGQRVEA